MKNKQQLEQKVESALNAFDGVINAIPKPFILTRINARLQAKQKNIWDNWLYFISRPAIAIAAVCIVIAINIFAIAKGDKANAILADETQNSYALEDDDIAINSIIIDNENIEP